MWIKICANTNLHDAQLAATLGADALGFVFAPSPRQVTPQQVADITPHLPHSIEKIGVFSTQDINEIAAAVHTAGLTGVQLHSSYSPQLIAALTHHFAGRLRLIQTAHWNVSTQNIGTQTTTDFAATIEPFQRSPHIAAVLVDSRTPSASGGTGTPFDWHAARQVLATLAPKPLILAGGLKPQNLAAAIRELNPWGVDVASGVEAHPGTKDPIQLAEFITIARQSQAS